MTLRSDELSHRSSKSCSAESSSLDSEKMPHENLKEGKRRQLQDELNMAIEINKSLASKFKNQQQRNQKVQSNQINITRTVM